VWGELTLIDLYRLNFIAGVELPIDNGEIKVATVNQ